MKRLLLALLFVALPGLLPVSSRGSLTFACATCPNTTATADAVGTYTVTMTVTNPQGLSGSASFPVTFTDPPPVGDTTAPVFTALTVTPNGKGKTVTVLASVYDAVGVARVDFRVNGVFKASVSTAPFSMTYQAKGNGPFTYTALAYDAAGNVGLSPVVVK